MTERHPPDSPDDWPDDDPAVGSNGDAFGVAGDDRPGAPAAGGPAAGVPANFRPAPVRFRPGKKRRWPRRILVFVNVLVFVSIIGVASAYGYINLQLGHIGRKNLSALREGGAHGKPFTMLLVGSDSRDIAGGNQFGGNQATPGQRSDTIMLARIVPANRTITLLSIPRDLYVNVQGMGETRINAAFDSGPNLLIQTIQNDLGIPIDHYAEVNFDTFQQITDAVGGVHFYFPTPARDAYSGLKVPAAGCVLLTGPQALGFVRSRHYQYYADGYWQDEAASDLARIQRQQAFIKRMVDKAQTKFDSPLAIDRIVSSVTKNLTVDSGFSNGLLLSLAKTFHGVNSSAIPTSTLATDPETIDGADVLTLDKTEGQQQIQAFNNIGVAPSSSGSTSTATTTPVSTKAPAHAPDPSSVSVEVVNGSGMSGQAAEATDAIKHYGYMATTISTSRAYVGAANVIHYSPDAKASAQLLASQMKGGAQLVSDASLKPTAFNLELITGSAYEGTNDQPATPATSSTTAAPTTSTTAPPAPGSATDTTYTLPGTPPGQKPPASCTP